MVWRTCCEKTEALLLDLTESWVRGQHPLLLSVPPMGLTSCTAIPLHLASPRSSFAMTASPPSTPIHPLDSSQKYLASPSSLP